MSSNPRGFSGKRAGLTSLEQSVRAAAVAHGTCFAIHVLLAVFALFSRHPWGALWMLLPGVVVHLYPVLLQRSIMLRLQPLLDKSGSGNFDVGLREDDFSARHGCCRAEIALPSGVTGPFCCQDYRCQFIFRAGRMN